MNRYQEIKKTLLSLCVENEILPSDIIISEDDDLFLYGVVDSMGLTLLQVIVEEHFKVHIAPEMLITELRTPKAIAGYIAAETVSAC